MPRRSRSRSPGRRRESRSPILRRRHSEHSRGGGGGGGRERERERQGERVRERRRGSHDPPVRRNHEKSDDRNTQNERGMGRRSEGGRQMWQNDVHPSRSMDVNVDSEMEENSASRTDRFATERFKKENIGRSLEEGGMEGRRGRGERGWRGGRRWERRSEGDGRGWREDVGGGRGRGMAVGRSGGFEEGMEGDIGERRRRFEGRRGRGGWRAAKEREEMEREEQVFREKRLMDSLTDPRDVPKGGWYFEHDDRQSAQTTQPSRRYSTGDERYRREHRGSRDVERERGRDRWGEGTRGGGERQRSYRQRSPRVWRHDMFEQLQREEEGEGEGREGEWGHEEGEQEIGNGRQQRRSVVHRLGTRPDDARGDHRQPRRGDAGVDGMWAHDKFSEHDQLVSYPIQQHRAKQRGGERGKGQVGEVESREEDFNKDKEQTEVSMDTI